MGEPSQVRVEAEAEAREFDPLVATVTDLGRSFSPRAGVGGICFRLMRDQVVALTGSPGAGKTTCLRLLAGVLRPTAGHVELLGRALGPGAAAGSRLVGYMPAGAPAYPDMTVAGFLGHVASLRGMAGRARQAGVHQAAVACGLSSALAQPVQELSHGFRRRLGLAQAIVHNPALLLVDEPTHGVSGDEAAAILGLLAGLARGRAVLVATGALAALGSLPARVLVLHDGVLVADHAADIAPVQPVGSTTAFRLSLVPCRGSGVAAPRLARLLGHLPGVLRVDCDAASAAAASFVLQVDSSCDLREAIGHAATANHLAVAEFIHVGAPLSAAGEERLHG